MLHFLIALYWDITIYHKIHIFSIFKHIHRVVQPSPLFSYKHPGKKLQTHWQPFLLIPFPQASGNHDLSVSIYFPILKISFKWNNTICDLLWPFYSILHNVFMFIHVVASISTFFFLLDNQLYRYIIFY